ncbi:MAG: RHS repeat-associated core domain-containing protein, partial [Gaiellaceae bacterium]
LGIDQITSQTGPIRDFSHRPDGEMTQRGSDVITWDGWGRNIGGTYGTNTVAYEYDPLGFRRKREASALTNHYLLGGLYETNQSGVIQNTDVAGVLGNLALYAGPPSTSSTVSYLYYNAHGDLAASADQTGTRNEAHSYDVFGSPLAMQPSNSVVERFAGRWDKKLDTTTSLIEMGVRPYDPTLGRFLAIDPVDGGSLNAYEYAGQDPINAYDLDGRVKIDTGSCSGCGGGSIKSVGPIWQGPGTGPTAPPGPRGPIGRSKPKPKKKAKTRCGRNSFAGVTKVTMPGGRTLPIRSVRVGDLVAARKPNGTSTLRPVTARMSGDAPKLVIVISLRGEDLVSTPDHRIWSATTSSWVQAASLRPGDRLSTITGGEVSVVAVRRALWPYPLFNLAVKGLHNYFVGNSAVLVHNEEPCPSLGDLERLSDRRARDLVGDPHAFKQDVLGTNKGLSRFDIAKSGDQLYLVSKDGSRIVPAGPVP